MKNKVAVICAANPGNSGMYSVDLAAENLFSRYKVEYDLFTSHTPARKGRYKLLKLGIDIGFKAETKFGKLNFKHYFDISQIEDYSHVLFWGDFTPNPVYGFEDFRYFDEIYDVKRNGEESIKAWARLYNFSQGRVDGKVMAIGNNFQHDYSRYAHDCQVYLNNISSCFDLIIPRDVFSKENLTSYLGAEFDYKKIQQGLDPAFLLRDETSIIKCNKGRYFCYAFGRSKLSNIDLLISSIENVTGSTGVNLSDWLQLSANDADIKFFDMIRKIKSSRFVITDLYHVAINSIRLETPVFCLGNLAGVQQGTLGDFKKKVLFNMLSLDKYYLEFSENSNDYADFVASFIIENIPEYEYNIREIYGVTRDAVRNFEDAIIKEITS